MSNRSAGAILAGVVLIVGIAVGFWPLSVDRGFVNVYDGDTVACGSAFGGLADNPDLSEFGADSRSAGYRAGCQEKLPTQRTIALVLIGMAGLGLTWLVLTLRAGTTPPSSMSLDSSTSGGEGGRDSQSAP